MRKKLKHQNVWGLLYDHGLPKLSSAEGYDVRTGVGKHFTLHVAIHVERHVFSGTRDQTRDQCNRIRLP